MDPDQSVPFIPKDAGYEEQGLYSVVDHKSDKWSWRRSFFVHGGLIVCYTIMSLLVIRNSGDEVGNFLPVELRFTPTVFHNLSNTPYAGEKPAGVLEQAWEHLLEPMAMRFSKEEFDTVNQESVALPENGGYLGWFGVFHNLHCVKMIRESFERARQCNSTEEISKKDKGHVDHCIELLRQAAVCQPDTSLTSFIWHPSTNLPMFNVSESVHRCADWDAFIETTKSRVVGDEELNRLKNPLLEVHLNPH